MSTEMMQSGFLKLPSRMIACLPHKIAVWLGLAAGITIPYFTLQRLACFPTQSVPAIWIDDWIAFSPEWAWVYQSIDVLVPLAPLLAATKPELGRYARGLALLCIPCFAVFLFFPVDGPRPVVPPDHAFYELLVAYDRPGNSMPSLHAGLVVYSLLFIMQVTRELRPQNFVRFFSGAAWVWGALILYSTLATKQHWVLDLPPAMLLAFGAHSWAWRGVLSSTDGDREPPFRRD